MKTYRIMTDKILLPDYIINSIRRLPWIDQDDESITFYSDDFLLVLYGVRGSTAFSGPDHLRYGSNTTAYQIWSPKLPVDKLYLGDGGSGILEIDQIIMKKLFQNKINPFTAPQSVTAQVLSGIINTFTHYHYDHLHLGSPLTGMFNANSIPKLIIGGDNPKQQFTKTFKRPMFPRDFGEVQANYSFYEISDPRSSVLILTPNGEFRLLTISEFNNFLNDENPQIRHNRVSYNLEDCVVVKCYPADHPDPCISFRYENYNSSGKLVSAVTFMTDHEIRETDDRNSYFMNHVKGSDVVYLDGQYNNQNFMPGYGHGRVEIIGDIAAKLNLENVIIGHHDPKSTDEQIDQMIALANDCYKSSSVFKDTNPGNPRIIGGADRLMIFVPSKERRRSGTVFGRMDLSKGQEILSDAIGPSSSIISDYKHFDLTQVYKTEDYTTTT